MLDDQRTKPSEVLALDESLDAGSLDSWITGKNKERIRPQLPHSGFHSCDACIGHRDQAQRPSISASEYLLGSSSTNRPSPRIIALRLIEFEYELLLTTS